MAITYVGALEDATAGASPKTVAVNIGTRTNGLLVVALCFYDNSLSTPAVTYAGTSMTLASEYPTTNGVYHVALYYLANPANGNNNLVITWTGTSLAMYVLASWYDGAAQTSPLDQVVTGTGSTDPSLNITPTADNELIVSHYYSGANDELTVGSGETKIDGYDFGADVTGGSYAIQTTAGTQTVDWAGVDDTWYMVVASFKQAAAGGAISGSTAGTSSASGALTGAGALAGTATAVGSPVATLIGDGALAGASAGLSTCSGNLEGLAEAAGTATGVGAASGVLDGEGALVGAASGVASNLAQLNGTGTLAGSSSGAATASGTLTPPSGDGAMIGASACTSSASGALFGTGALAGSIDGIAGASALLEGIGSLSGSAAGEATATANLVILLYISMALTLLSRTDDLTIHARSAAFALLTRGDYLTVRARGDDLTIASRSAGLTVETRE